ncbi:hypothetical protein F4803DRAFT_266815 [Xylaria telfairii]|nr:hypothetical protein F4803DRAFT_266815 [Xylaria telfairii]
MSSYLLAAEEVTIHGRETVSSSFLSRLFARPMLLRMDNAVCVCVCVCMCVCALIVSNLQPATPCLAVPVPYWTLVWSPLSLSGRVKMSRCPDHLGALTTGLPVFQGLQGPKLSTGFLPNHQLYAIPKIDTLRGDSSRLAPRSTPAAHHSPHFEHLLIYTFALSHIGKLCLTFQDTSTIINLVVGTG